MLPRSFFTSGRARAGLQVASFTLLAASAVVGAALPSSCAAGNELGTGGATSAEESASVGSTSTSAQSSTSGAGGDQGSTTSASTSGAGGGGSGGSSAASSGSSSSSASSSASSSSASSSASSSSGSGGAPPTGTVLLLAGGGPKVLAGEFHGGGAWSTTQLSSTTDKAPGIAMTGAGAAIGVIRNTTFGNEVAYTTWAPGSFQAFTSIANLVTTQAAPSIVASGTRADVVFLGDNNKHYYAAHVATWSPTAESVGLPMGVQSSGPSAAGVTAIGSDTIVAFAGDNGDLYDQTRTGGAWLAASPHNLGGTAALTPAIVTLTAGPALMIVYVRSTDAKILYTTRTGNVWTAPTVIDANSFTADRVALASLPGGEAILAFRGLDQGIYFSRYNPVGAPLWSPPQPLATPNIATTSSPAVAAGVGGVDAEIGFVNVVDGKAYHARLTGLTWSAPVLVGGTQLTTISIASAP